MNSKWQRADLESIDEAAAYAQHPELRAGLLNAFRTASAAFSAVEARGETQAPWRVLDRGFGREAVGQWIGGPVDSFKAWASGTLFAALAARAADAELQSASLELLSYFRGDVIYSPAGPGTAGFVEGTAREPAAAGAEGNEAAIVLQRGDPFTLSLLKTTWEQVAREVRRP